MSSTTKILKYIVKNISINSMPFSHMSKAWQACADSAQTQRMLGWDFVHGISNKMHVLDDHGIWISLQDPTFRKSGAGGAQ